MKGYACLSVLCRAPRRSKASAVFSVLFTLLSVAAGLRLFRLLGSALDLPAGAGAVKAYCLQTAAAALCTAAAKWSASACGTRIVRETARILRRQVRAGKPHPACAVSVTGTDAPSVDVDRLAEDLISPLFSLLFGVAAAIAAFVSMLRFSLGASIVVVLPAPLPLLVEAWIARSPLPYRSLLPDRPAAELIRRAVFAAATVSGAFSASLIGGASVGAFVRFLACAHVFLKVCCTTSEYRRRFLDACADMTQFPTLSDLADAEAAA